MVRCESLLRNNDRSDCSYMRPRAHFSFFPLLQQVIRIQGYSRSWINVACMCAAEEGKDAMLARVLEGKYWRVLESHRID